MRMDLRQRKVSEHEAELLAKMLLHSLDDGKGKTAGRAFIVPILDQSRGGLQVALDVVGGVDWN
jgi:hypothetical protein